MGTYRVAEICPNGHVSTSSADTSPELREKFCSSCGEQTLTQCPSCNAAIRGFYHVEGVLSIRPYDRPAFCFNCGKPFPWTERAIVSAVELVDEASDLSEQELEQFRTDLTELTKDTPKAQVASLRFKKIMGRVGNSVSGGVRDIVVEILSETAKKAIWGV